MNYKIILKLLILSNIYVVTSFSGKKTTTIFEPPLLTDFELEQADSIVLSDDIRARLLGKKYCEYKKLIKDDKVAGDPADPAFLHAILKFMKDNGCMSACHQSNVKLVSSEYFASLRARRLNEFKEKFGDIAEHEGDAIFDSTRSLDRSDRSVFITTMMRRISFSRHELERIGYPVRPERPVRERSATH